MKLVSEWYVLIPWGGVIEGQRPRTVLAVAESRTADKEWLCRIVDSKTLRPKYKGVKKVKQEDILHNFSRPPSPAAVRRAKKLLSIT